MQVTELLLVLEKIQDPVGSFIARQIKNSLIRQEFVSRYPDAIVIDQKSIGISSRSTPASYTGVLDEIRKLFAKKTESVHQLYVGR